MINFKLNTSLLVLGLAFASCKKDHTEQTVAIVPLQVEADNSASVVPVIAPRINLPLQPTKLGFQEVFDWETAAYMPHPADKPKIPVPWSDEASRMYNPAMRYDYKRADGWELVYSAFTSKISIDIPPTFTLYNKFRGVLRSYVYVSASFSNDIKLENYFSYANRLSLPLTTSKLLNFANQLIVDVDDNANRVTHHDPFVLTNKAWYIAEYELAFDPALSSKTNLDIIEFKNEFIAPKGTINNKTLTNSTGISFQIANENVIQNNAPGELSFRLSSGAELNGYGNYLSATTIVDLKNQLSATQGQPNVYSAMLIPGTAQNLLRIPAAVEVPELFNSIVYTNINYSVPGKDNSAVIGAGPIFNETPGIFFLAKKPEIKSAAITGNFSYEYNIVANSVVYQFNPFIDAYATIESIDQEIVAVEDVTDLNLAEATLYHGHILRSNKPLKILGVRVSFNVVPKNGSKKIMIVKTFAVNEVK
jgi:hypothetical protein